MYSGSLGRHVVTRPWTETHVLKVAVRDESKVAVDLS